MNSKSRDTDLPIRATLRAIWPALLLGLVMRVALLGFYHVDSGMSLEQISRGHDGEEYAEFARAIAANDYARVPPQARRHHVGYPSFLAPFVWTEHQALCGVVLGWLALAGATLLGAHILSRELQVDARQLRLWSLALLACYPSEVYYSCFALNESLFMLLLVAAVAAWLSGRSAIEYGVVAIAGLVRGTGLLLAAAFLLLDCTSRKWRRVLFLPVAVVPYAIVSSSLRKVWGVDTISIHQPRFGFPFSGFLHGVDELGAARIAYILISVTGVLVLIALLCRDAQRARWRRPLLNVSALFCGLFFLFHVSLRSLVYYGSEIPTLNYQDRYLVPLLPFALIPLLPRLRSWMIATGAAASFLISAAWGHSYLKAVQEGKRPSLVARANSSALRQ